MSFEIGNVVETQKPFNINIASVVTGRTFIASITRFGKSWTARKIVEECFGHAGIIILDPEGEYSSLREKFPFLIIGKDVPLQLETAEFMAEKVLESKLSVIIDLSMVEDDELGKEYVSRFLHRFFFLETTARQPYLVVVEEAEDFAGEKGIGTETCLRILINIVKKGGKRGIGALFVAHRPAWVSKGILSQCANKVLGKIESTDFDALKKYARVPDEVIESLPKLKVGEFCFVGDWVSQPTFVSIGKVLTTHLGFTPGLVPPSPKELQNVIQSLQKALPEVIEKVKPTVVPLAEMETKVRAQIEQKYKDRIETIQRTAEEKAERKFKVEMENLKALNAELSRSQTLQPTTPITDVLEHPIVKTRMLELPANARDMLVKIEREPGVTREQLAAFLTTSTDSVSSLVDRVNRTFKVTAIIGDGRPMRYRSMLKRLFLTDPAKREIQEIERLQVADREKTARITALTQETSQLRSSLFQQGEELKKTSSSLEENDGKLRWTRTELGKAAESIKSLQSENERFVQEKKQLILTSKTGEMLSSILSLTLDNRLNTFKHEILSEIKNSAYLIQPIDEGKIVALIDQRVNEAADKIKVAFVPNGSAQNDVEIGLQQTTKIVTVDPVVKRVIVGMDTVKGRILGLAKDSYFDAWKTAGEVQVRLTDDAFTCTPQAVNQALGELVNGNILGMKHTDRNRYKLSQDVVFEEPKIMEAGNNA